MVDKGSNITYGFGNFKKSVFLVMKLEMILLI